MKYKLTDEIAKIKDRKSRESLKAVSEYLIPVAMMDLVSYIIKLEGKDG